jgi:hypothetical protein
MPAQSLPYAVAILDSIADWEEIQCTALAAVWTPWVGGARLHNADDNPVRFQSYEAAFSFVMKCAHASIKTRGPTLDHAA